MKKIPLWTIWIPVVGIFFFRLRIESGKTKEVETNFVIFWMLYWIIISLAIIGLVFYNIPWLRKPLCSI